MGADGGGLGRAKGGLSGTPRGPTVGPRPVARATGMRQIDGRSPGGSRETVAVVRSTAVNVVVVGAGGRAAARGDIVPRRVITKARAPASPRAQDIIRAAEFGARPRDLTLVRASLFVSPPT